MPFGRQDVIGKPSLKLPALPDPPGPPEPRPVTPGLLAAREAKKAATDGLLSAIDRGPAVRETVARVVEHARLNHIGRLVDDTWERRR